jgi:hypothetical protein
VLISLICIAIALAIFAGAFYLAKYVVSLQHRIHVLEDSYTQATEHIKEQEKQIILQQQEIEHMRMEEQLASQRGVRQRSWNPDNPLNGGMRM